MRLKKTNSMNSEKDKGLSMLQTSAARIVEVTGSKQETLAEMDGCRATIDQLEEQIRGLKAELHSKRSRMAECQTTLIDDLIDHSKKKQANSK